MVSDLQKFGAVYAVMLLLLVVSLVNVFQLSGAFLSPQACGQLQNPEQFRCQRFRVFGSLMLFACVAFPIVYVAETSLNPESS